jgi:hypothetical protein
VVWRDVVARLHSESPAIQIYAAAYAEQLGYPVEATSIYRRFLTRTDSPSSRRDQPMERRKAYLGILRNSSQSMSLDDLTSLCSSIVEEFPDMDEARNDLHYLRLLQNKVDPTAAEEVDRLFYSHPQMLAVRSTLALTLLRQGRIQAAHEVYARCQIDWATAPDRYKAVRIAVLDAAGNFFQADQLRSTLNISNLRDEEMKLAGVEVLRAEVSTKR